VKWIEPAKGIPSYRKWCDGYDSLGNRHGISKLVNYPILWLDNWSIKTASSKISEATNFTISSTAKILSKYIYTRIYITDFNYNNSNFKLMKPMQEFNHLLSFDTTRTA
jgi:hypothetical protein